LKDFISKLLIKNPDQRLGAKNGVEEILSHPWLKAYNLEQLKKKKD